MARLVLDYASDALGKMSVCTMVLPNAWQEDRRPWPVVYLLHGLGDDHSVWSRRTAIERYVEQHRLFVVMPDGGRGFYADARQPAVMAYEQHILELVERIDALFPTVRDRSGRGIGGNSMGGYGATTLALRHPERFGSVTSHSGALDMRSRIEGEWVASYWERDEAGLIFGSDLPDDRDPFRLAECVDPRPALHIDCGDEDFLLDGNHRFRAHLAAIGYPHTYHEEPGLHNWAYWDRVVPRGLAFHAERFAAAGHGGGSDTESDASG